ncbi:MAG: hypothetical protein ABI822_01870 [Bryobacteraceae bacterium]
MLTALFLAILAGGSIYAHQQPTTLVVLGVGSDQVAMDLHGGGLLEARSGKWRTS